MRNLFHDKDIRKYCFNDYGFKKESKKALARKSRRVRKQFIKNYGNDAREGFLGI